MERKSKDFFTASGDFSGRNKEPELPWETFINYAVFQFEKEKELSQVVFIFGKMDCSCVALYMWISKSWL